MSINVLVLNNFWLLFLTSAVDPLSTPLTPTCLTLSTPSLLKGFFADKSQGTNFYCLQIENQLEPILLVNDISVKIAELFQNITNI